MLDEEGHVKADDHEPEGPLTEPLREHAAAHFGKPILQAAKDCEDNPAYRYKVKMCDKKIAVLSLPIERHHSMADSRYSGQKELNQKRDAEQHRNLKTNATADHRCGPVKYFYPGWNRDQHRRNGEEHIKWTAHPHGEHVMPPYAQT